ncbi:MAG: mechanosensitive ion channel [Gammaproteobacteria bacterium]|nr:mechanosensitive ion channel [Gammaproteobacteria bacterium]
MIDEVQESVWQPMVGLWTKVAEFLPNIAGAILLLVVGYLVAKMIALIITKLLAKLGLDKLTERSGIASAVQSTGLQTSASAIFGKIVYWLIFLTFMISAADTLGLPRVSSTIDDFVLYLPKLIGAMLVVIIGLFAAHMVRTAIETAAQGMQLEYGKALASLIYALMVIVIISLAIGQLEIETDLLNQVISIILFAVGAAVALSLGMGTRATASNIIAGLYARDLFPPGDKITVGEVSGRVMEVSTTNTLLELDDGTMYTLPNSVLVENQVHTTERI